MSAKIIKFYDYDEEAEIECLQCRWKGKVKDGAIEHYRDLFDVSCPKCDETLLVIGYPTDGEVIAAAERGVKKAVEDMPTVRYRQLFFKLFDESKLKGPEQLPELPGQNLDFMWDFEQAGDESLTIGSKWTVILFNGVEIWREIALWEGWKRFNEVKAILEQKYGVRFRSLTPTKKSEMYLYGDDLSALSQVSVGPSKPV